MPSIYIYKNTNCLTFMMNLPSTLELCLKQPSSLSSGRRTLEHFLTRIMTMDVWNVVGFLCSVAFLNFDSKKKHNSVHLLVFNVWVTTYLLHPSTIYLYSTKWQWDSVRIESSHWPRCFFLTDPTLLYSTTCSRDIVLVQQFEGQKDS